MAQAREAMRGQYGNMITYHNEVGGGADIRMRANNNTFKSNIAFDAP